ncbi:AtpZ/AtpI family protein [Membranicola marinus]|uniref:AtpZ/AtpI family protein n=1 Tax=Membranihabitans marinus TaxID=1227546 RepID=A0A953HV22_9BACT|nr:AtpZ/AtpI family protein [Membranihabitans marinus]MBY5958985.1 AtpZ/AtpI family protein [Membranihabitans marinus]
MKKERPTMQRSFSKEIGDKADRKLKAQKEKPRAWSGFGLFGIIGWSVVVPTLLGAALGVWLDKRYPQPFSWTLSLLVAGLIAGLAMAWNWVEKENQEINKKTNQDDD